MCEWKASHSEVVVLNGGCNVQAECFTVILGLGKRST